jgi:hypothetical protein
VDKLAIHQANERLIDQMATSYCRKYDLDKEKTERVIKEKVIMMIEWLANNSAASLPIMYNLIKRGEVDITTGRILDQDEMPRHVLRPGTLTQFLTVGAGMGEAALLYKEPLEDSRKIARRE